MSKTAELYRMVMPDHVCPYGLKAKHLLETEGYEIDDHYLETEAETEAFKERHDVPTTPQVWIDGERIGGYDALREHFGEEVQDEDETTYRPVLALFAVAALIAVAIGVVRAVAAGPGSGAGGGFLGLPAGLDLGDVAAAVLAWQLLPDFVATAMILLALQKLQDVESFSTMFLNYDLLARRWVPYGYIYPYGEAAAGVLMLAGVLPWVSAPIALFIGGVGAVSVFKAVYVDKRELKCACVGGGSNVPLGFVSLTENLFMLGMGAWTVWRVLA